MQQIILLTPEMIPQVGNVLYKLRDKMEVSQKTLSERMNKSQSTLSLLENSRKLAKMPTVANYLRALGNGTLAIVIDLPEDDEQTYETAVPAPGS